MITLDLEWEPGDCYAEMSVEGTTRELVVRFPKWPAMVVGLRALGTVPPAWCYNWFTSEVKLTKYRVGQAEGDEQMVTMELTPKGEGKWT